MECLKIVRGQRDVFHRCFFLSFPLRDFVVLLNRRDARCAQRSLTCSVCLSLSFSLSSCHLPPYLLTLSEQKSVTTECFRFLFFFQSRKNGCVNLHKKKNSNLLRLLYVCMHKRVLDPVKEL